jgi:glutamate/tyrosine decarboxylase-like PLP-dependent enzyme
MPRPAKADVNPRPLVALVATSHEVACANARAMRAAVPKTASQATQPPFRRLSRHDALCADQHADIRPRISSDTTSTFQTAGIARSNSVAPRDVLLKFSFKHPGNLAEFPPQVYCSSEKYRCVSDEEGGGLSNRSEDGTGFWNRGLSRLELDKQLLEFQEMSRFGEFDKNFFEEGPHLTSSTALPEGDSVRAFSVDAYRRFIDSVMWDTGEGARQMETEIVRILGRLLHNPDAVGRITSGGSESDICALAAAKARAFVKRYPDVGPRRYPQAYSPTDPDHPLNVFQRESKSVVLPYHSHYSLYKGCALLGLEPISVPPISGSYYEVDVEGIRAAIREDTIAIVGTAGTYPYGTIDPISELSEIAIEHDLYLHVDACFGGFILPFLEISGYHSRLAPWDFAAPGVCSISADLHKNGMAPPPASTLTFRNQELLDNLRSIAPPFGTVSGTRPSAPVAAAWTIVRHLGLDGYLQVAQHSMKLRDDMAEGLASIPGVKVLPGSMINLLVAYSEDLDLRPVVNAMRDRGWMITTKVPPTPVAITLTFMPQNDGQIEAFADDLRTEIERCACPLGELGEDYDCSPYGALKV